MKVCIVDAVSTGNLLAPEFIKQGHECIHIQTFPSYTDSVKKTFKEQDFTTHIHASDISYSEILKQLKQQTVQLVLPGSEPAVSLAEKLSQDLNISQTNDAQTTHWRRNKFFAQERLNECGLASIRQLRTDSLTEILKWREQQDLSQIVLKPLDSACSDNVYICESQNEITEAFNNIYNHTNHLHQINSYVLAQAFIEGTQYFVNAVSYDGQHYITDIWQQIRSRNPEGAYFFEAMTLSDPDDSHIQSLIQYNISVLNALGVQYGATHNELLITNNGPVLIECNARLMGASIDYQAFHNAIGITQAELMVQSYLQPTSFLQQYAGSTYTPQNNLAEISFLFKQSGILKSFLKRPAIESLPSFSHVTGIQPLGSQVEKTLNTFGSPGYAYLINPDKKQLRQDMQTVLEWQKNNQIFEVI